MKVKSILVTQPRPESEKSPYFELSKKFNVKIDFRPFIHLEGISGHDFRKTKIKILEHGSVILTSRNSVDHFFRMCTEMRVVVPDDLKYFCISESTAYYLQKYIVFRKRKVFSGNQTFSHLMDIIKKHKEDNFLLPVSDIHKQEIPLILKKNKIKFTKAIFYKTVCSDLGDLAKGMNHDILVFFSPADIKSLFKNIPKFKQKQIKIAAFGSTTIKAAVAAGLKVDIPAPTPQAPSMTMALQQYIVKAGNNSRKPYCNAP